MRRIGLPTGLPEEEAPPEEPVPTRGSGKRLGLGVGIVVVLAGILAWVTLARKPAVPTAPVSLPLPSPAAEGALTPTGPDWDAIAREIVRIETQATLERRPELLDEIDSPSCTYCQPRRELIEELARKGIRYVGYDPGVIKVFFLGQGAPERADLRVVTEQGPWVGVDDTGREVGRSEGWGPRSRTLHLTWNETKHRWMISLTVPEGPAEEIIGPDWRTR